MSLPIFKVGLLTSVNLIYICLPDSPDCPISLAILRFVKLTINNVITGIRKCKVLFSGFHLKEMFDLPLVSLEVFGRGAVQTVSTYIRKAALRGRVYVYYLPKLQSIKASISELANTESLLQGEEKRLASQGALVTTFLWLVSIYLCFVCVSLNILLNKCS